MVDQIMFEGLLLSNVHAWEDCQYVRRNGRWQVSGRPCVIHKPTPHHMRTWRLTWRNDRGIFERQCPHGIGHPDPDQFDYWRETDRMYESVHGCCWDGCCREPQFTNPAIQIGHGNTQTNYF